MVKIGQYEEAFLYERSTQIVNEKTSKSNILDREAEDMLPKFAPENELVMGTVLGKGGFCTVFEVTKVTIADTLHPIALLDATAENFIVQDRNYMAQRYIREKDGQSTARYALKKLSAEHRKDPERFVAGVIDLALEARFLAVLKHPHIIKMRALSNASPCSDSFFVVLDRLYDTLSDRLQAWKNSKVNTTGIFKLIDLKGKKKNALLTERIIVAHNISSALGYLHSRNIVYRDLKPDNIGFDCRGDVKIFDFGLAKELIPSDVMADGTYKLSGSTGSLRYMAPEVALGKPYNEKVDSFSFGMLFWQMLALDVPFAKYNVKMHKEFVVLGGARPKVKEDWPFPLSNLIQNSWSADMNLRPTMDEASVVIMTELSKVMGVEDMCELDASSKTARSL